MILFFAASETRRQAVVDREVQNELGPWLAGRRMKDRPDKMICFYCVLPSLCMCSVSLAVFEFALLQPRQERTSERARASSQSTIIGPLLP